MVASLVIAGGSGSATARAEPAPDAGPPAAETAAPVDANPTPADAGTEDPPVATAPPAVTAEAEAATSPAVTTGAEAPTPTADVTPERAEEVAPPAVFSGSTTAVLEWRDDNRNARDDDDDFGDGIMRTNLALDGGDTRASMRLDGGAFVSRPPGGDRRDDLRIERVALELDRELLPSGALRTQLAVGDFYAHFGHGLALSLRRVDELGIDTALRGARTDVLMLDDGLTVTLLAGVTNPVNIESTRLRFTEDAEDRLAAARIEGHIADLTLGAHVVGMRQHLVPAGSPHPQTANYGATADLSAGDVGVSLEADGQARDLGTETATGLAIHGSATGHVERVTVLVEGKHYAQFETLYGSTATYLDDQFAYSAPPTAERIDQEVLDNTDVTGGRVRVDLATVEATSSSVYANAALFRDRLLGLWFAHAYGGVDQRFEDGEMLLVTGGYRREMQSDDGALFRAIAHGELDVLLPLSQALALHFIAQYQAHLERLGTANLVYHRGNGSLELDVGTEWAVAYGMDLNTQDQRDGVRHVFAYGTLRFRPSDWWVAQLLAGSQRGGIRCIAGACRDVPPFSGLRVETTLRY